MRKIIRILRKTGLILVLLLAAFAVGLSGHYLPITRERYRNKGITTEQLDKKRKED